MQQSDAERAAIGKIAALIPQVAELVEYRAALGDRLSQDDIRVLVLARARELGLLPGGDRLLTGAELPSPLLDASLWEAAQLLIASGRTHLGEMTVRDLIVRFSSFLNLDQLLLDYVEQSVASGSPAPFPDIYRGAVTPITQIDVGGFQVGPLVLVAVTPLDSLDERVTELRDVCLTHFKGFRTHKVQTYEELALIGELMQRGLTRKEITWHMVGLKSSEIAAASDEERERNYKPEYTRERARLRKMFQRLDSK